MIRLVIAREKYALKTGQLGFPLEDTVYRNRIYMAAQLVHAYIRLPLNKSVYVRRLVHARLEPLAELSCL